jgi:hypothetical protein
MRASLQAFLTCIFCQSLGHQTYNYPYRSSRILPTQIILIDYRPYLMSTRIQSLVSNVHNSIYPLTLPNVFHKKFMRVCPICKFEKLKVVFFKHYKEI